MFRRLWGRFWPDPRHNLASLGKDIEVEDPLMFEDSMWRARTWEQLIETSGNCWFCFNWIPSERVNELGDKQLPQECELHENVFLERKLYK